MNFSQTVEQGLQSLGREERVAQDNFLKIICEDVRGMDWRVVKESGAFYVPNEEWMVKIFGSEIKSEDWGCYRGSECKWQNYLVFPVRGVKGEIAGFAGFNPHVYVQSKETGEKVTNYYTYSGKELWQKGDFLFGLKGTFLKAVEEGYLILVDGLFDCLSLSGEGFLSMALMGSSVSEKALAQLVFVDKIILAVDNDEAGERLAGFLKRKHPNVRILRQGWVKDADEVLKGEHREEYLRKLRGLIQF